MATREPDLASLTGTQISITPVPVSASNPPRSRLLDHLSSSAPIAAAILPKYASTSVGCRHRTIVSEDRVVLLRDLDVGPVLRQPDAHRLLYARAFKHLDPANILMIPAPPPRNTPNRAYAPAPEPCPHIAASVTTAARIPSPGLPYVVCPIPRSISRADSRTGQLETILIFRVSVRSEYNGVFRSAIGPALRPALPSLGY